MSVGTLTIQLPSRACWWIKAIAKREKYSVNEMVLELLLRQLTITPGVDLSRSPDISTEGGSDE